MKTFRHGHKKFVYHAHFQGILIAAARKNAPRLQGNIRLGYAPFEAVHFHDGQVKI